MAKGRIILKTLATSKKMIAAIKQKPEFEEFLPLLYSWINTHTDDYGRFDADPLVVKCKIMPLSTRTEDNFLDALNILESVNLIKRYCNNAYLEIVDFDKVQTFRTDRTRQKAYPDNTNGSQCHTNDIPETYQEDTISKDKISKDKISKETPSGNGKPLPPICPHKDIIDLYHEILPELPRISMITENGKKVYNWKGDRQSHLRSRWRESENRQTLEWWKGFFNHIRQSDFLMGRKDPTPGHKQFTADLDFILRPSKFNKIIEGIYHKE